VRAAAAACGSCGAIAIAGRTESGMGPDRDERTEYETRPPDLRRHLHFAHSGPRARFEIVNYFCDVHLCGVLRLKSPM